MTGQQQPLYTRPPVVLLVHTPELVFWLPSNWQTLVDVTTYRVRP